jgi:hypothetical protein
VFPTRTTGENGLLGPFGTTNSGRTEAGFGAELGRAAEQPNAVTAPAAPMRVLEMDDMKTTGVVWTLKESAGTAA